MRRVSAVLVAGIAIPLPEATRAPLAPYRDRPVVLGIRPEDLREQPADATQAQGATLPLELRVVAIEALGPEVILIASLADGPEIAARLGRDFSAAIGSPQRLYLDPAAIHLFDPRTTQAIRTQAAPP